MRRVIEGGVPRGKGGSPVTVLIVLLGLLGSTGHHALAATKEAEQALPSQQLAPAAREKSLAPVALYPNQLSLKVVQQLRSQAGVGLAEGGS